MSATLKELHDELLATKPADASHDTASCPLCKLEVLTASEETTTHADPEGGGTVTDTTFTQAEVDAKIAEATKAATDELAAKLAALEAQIEETEVGKAVAEAVAGKDTEIAALQTSLDEATVKAAAAEKLAEDTHAFFADAIEAEVGNWETLVRKDERLAELAKLEAFDEAYLTEHGDRFAAMSDEDFKARLEEYQKLGAVAKVEDGKIPAFTAMADARPGSATTDSGSALGALPLLRRGALGDPRTL